jgi:hypothetical protein
VCALCQAPGPLPWLTSEFCERCYTDLIAGFHRRYEASLRLARSVTRPATRWPSCGRHD